MFLRKGATSRFTLHWGSAGYMLDNPQLSLPVSQIVSVAKTRPQARLTRHEACCLAEPTILQMHLHVV